MVVRLTGSALGLFAFAVTMVAGLWVGNPVPVTLSRSIFALFLFFIIGIALGGAAQAVLNEHQAQRERALRERIEETAKEADEDAAKSEDEIPVLEVAGGKDVA
jgi:hypothetical protein